MSEAEVNAAKAEALYQRQCRQYPVGIRVFLDGDEDVASGLVTGRVNIRYSMKATVAVPAHNYDWTGEWVKVESPKDVDVWHVEDLEFAHPTLV